MNPNGCPSRHPCDSTQFGGTNRHYCPAHGNFRFIEGAWRWFSYFTPNVYPWREE